MTCHGVIGAMPYHVYLIEAMNLEWIDLYPTLNL
jgi:hypothetical protein